MSETGEAAGFTLFEMLVVLAILGLIGGIVFPGLERGILAQQYRGAVADAVGTLRTARARAVAVDAPVRLSVGADGGAILVGGSMAEPLPRTVRAATVPASGILFFGDGTSGGGSLAVTDGNRVARLMVQPATGLFGASAG